MRPDFVSDEQKMMFDFLLSKSWIPLELDLINAIEEYELEGEYLKYKKGGGVK